MKIRSLSRLAATAAAASFAFTGSAHAAAFTNGSFEDGPGGFTTVGAGDSTSIPGWTVTSGTVDYLAGFYPASDGNDSLDMNGLDAGEIAQTFDTLPGTPYVVTFDQSHNNGCGRPASRLRVVVGGSFEDYDNSNAAGVYTQRTFRFIGTGSNTLSFLSLSPSCGGPLLDNVRVAVDSPPSTSVTGDGTTASPGKPNAFAFDTASDGGGTLAYSSSTKSFDGAVQCVNLVGNAATIVAEDDATGLLNRTMIQDNGLSDDKLINTMINPATASPRTVLAYSTCVAPNTAKLAAAPALAGNPIHIGTPPVT